ncbi:MAG: hypothetical protein ACXWH0_11200 [Acidimicrobiia bacterium]
MSQAQTESKNTAFDGRIRLNGDAAPELEVVVELGDDYIVLGHSSGELGRWDRSSVAVAPIGRGWFTLNVEDETVTFLPRRPGHFAASTVDLVPVEVTERRWWQRSKDTKEPPAETATLSRKERRQLKRDGAARTTFGSAVAEDESPAEIETTAPPVEPGPAPERTEPAPTPIEPRMVPVDLTPAQAPEMRPPDVASPSQAEPASPWDDLPVPEIPDRKPRATKQPRSVPEAPPRPVPAKTSSPPREKAPKPPKPARTKAPRGRAVEPAGTSRPVRPAGQKKRNVFSRAFAGFWHGLKGIALRVSDELRQTGIVPFDRLPAAPARSRPNENHQHDFQEHRLPGGLTRNVCHSCGLVSIGGFSEDD